MLKNTGLEGKGSILPLAVKDRLQISERNCFGSEEDNMLKRFAHGNIQGQY